MMVGETFYHTGGMVDGPVEVRITGTLTSEPPKPVTIQDEVAAIRRMVEVIQDEFRDSRRDNMWFTVAFLVVLVLAILT